MAVGWHNLIKIGYTAQPIGRRKKLKHTSKKDIIFAYTSILLNAPRFVEQVVHAVLRKYGVGNELFEIPIATAIYTIEMVIQGIENGHKIELTRECKPARNKMRRFGHSTDKKWPPMEPKRWTNCAVCC